MDAALAGWRSENGGVGPDWVLDPRAGLVLAGTHLGGLSGVMGGYQQD